MLRIADTFIVENPDTLETAFELLTHYGDAARIVAGGTDILPNIKHGLHAPEVLVNLKSIAGLNAIKIGDEFIEIGALASIHNVANHKELGRVLPSLSHAASMVAGPQLRHMGTVGGNVCLDTRCVYINQTHFWREALGFCIKKDGTACHVVATGKKCVAAASNDTAPVLMTLGAELEIQSPAGARTSSLEDFYVNDGVKNNDLAPDEILTRVRIPRPGPDRRMAFQKLRVRGAIDFPMLNMSLVFDLKDGQLSNMDLVVSAIAARPRRVKNLPTGTYDEALVAEACDKAFRQVRPLTSINGDVVWRREMVPVLLRRAFVDAAGEPA
jgi:4-hydroxybenzoyl-CoA reductase subunit beta